jgi:hypothetical protein
MPESLTRAPKVRSRGRENFEKLDAMRHFPAISEAERHAHKMHILGKFCRKNLT